MFLLVGWHYVKQGFGVMTVLAARRGVRFRPRERLAILAHCFAGWAYAWASPADPGTRGRGEGRRLHDARAPARARARHARRVPRDAPSRSSSVLVRKWRREGRLPLLTPLTALLCSVWAWSIYSSVDPLVRYVIPALHSVQYLYFVWLLEGNEAREREGPPWFETSARVRARDPRGVGARARLAPLPRRARRRSTTLLVPRRVALGPTLGPTPYFAALYAFVNIHHYFMDYVIWRRDNPQTRYLLHTRGA